MRSPAQMSTALSGTQRKAGNVFDEEVSVRHTFDEWIHETDCNRPEAGPSMRITARECRPPQLCRRPSRGSTVGKCTGQLQTTIVPHRARAKSISKHHEAAISKERRPGMARNPLRQHSLSRGERATAAIRPRFGWAFVGSGVCASTVGNRGV